MMSGNFNGLLSRRNEGRVKCVLKEQKNPNEGIARKTEEEPRVNTRQKLDGLPLN